MSFSTEYLLTVFRGHPRKREFTPDEIAALRYFETSKKYGSTWVEKHAETLRAMLDEAERDA